MITGVIGIAILLLLCFIGVPVSFAMLLTGFFGFAYMTSFQAALSVVGIETFGNFSSYSFTVMPMFILMGGVAFASGISKRLYDASYTLCGSMRGGLSISTIIGCAMFSAICGSTAATAASMGAVALPEMKRYKYDDRLATGCVAAGGTLGILIPPSGALVFYGIITEQSIGKLLIAGILPGLLLAALFIATIAIITKRNPDAAPAGPATNFKQKLSGLSGLIEMLVLFALVMGGLFLGWFSPTQAGAAGAAGAIIISLAKRSLTWRGLIEAFKETILVSGMVMMIIVGGLIFSRFMMATNIPFLLTDWLTEMSIPPLAIMAIIIIIHIIGGCVMDSMGLIVITVPILFPVITALGFDPIWFGVMIVLFIETGTITPPIGLNAFVIKGIAKDVPLETIFKGLIPFVGAVFVCIVLLLFFPEIATFLPNLMK